MEIKAKYIAKVEKYIGDQAHLVDEYHKLLSHKKPSEAATYLSKYLEFLELLVDESTQFHLFRSHEDYLDFRGSYSKLLLEWFADNISHISQKAELNIFLKIIGKVQAFLSKKVKAKLKKSIFSKLTKCLEIVQQFPTEKLNKGLDNAFEGIAINLGQKYKAVVKTIPEESKIANSNIDKKYEKVDIVTNQENEGQIAISSNMEKRNEKDLNTLFKLYSTLHKGLLNSISQDLPTTQRILEELISATRNTKINHKYILEFFTRTISTKGSNEIWKLLENECHLKMLNELIENIPKFLNPQINGYKENMIEKNSKIGDFRKFGLSLTSDLEDIDEYLDNNLQIKENSFEAFNSYIIKTSEENIFSPQAHQKVEETKQR